MSKMLVVVDMQNDFINGVLGTYEAVNIVPKVAEKVKNWDGHIVLTKDTHGMGYEKTLEGKSIPRHCIDGSYGWRITQLVQDALEERVRKGMAIPDCIFKDTFGFYNLPVRISREGVDYVEFVGLCTDKCVISNVLIYKSFAPDMHIAVDASCCAGSTVEDHEAALMVMKSCGIDILNYQKGDKA